MIKGKFYAGLTSEMMTRSRTVDRQQTNFFWPDETDAESATPTTRAKRIVSKSMTANNNSNNNNCIDTTTTQSDIKPKELFRKQLSSGIEFYDNVNAKTPEARRRRFKKIDNINLNNNNDNDFQPEKKKLETFSSKIEFYDFENESIGGGSVKKNEKKEKIEKPVGKAINMMDADERRNDDDNNNKKSKMDSPDVGKKRISFQTSEKMAEKTKSILKNSDERSNVDKVIVKPLPKRGLFPKNLSKSVENISKMAKSFENDEIVDDNKTVEKLSTIIREVKDLNLSKDDDRRNNYRNDDRDLYYRETDTRRRSNLDRDYDRGYDSRSGYRDRYDERYRNEQPSAHKYNNRYDDYNDRGDREYMDRRNERFQRNAYSKSPKDPYEYKDQRPGGWYEEGRIRDKRSPPNYDREYDVELKQPRTPIRDVKPASSARDVQRKSIDRYYDEPSSNRSAQHAIDDEEEEYSACISRKPKHIPQHLRTNILFNGKVRPQAQRPMSVRNSAVTRVGVGLPDIE